jgi:hypothetical protein
MNTAEELQNSRLELDKLLDLCQVDKAQVSIGFGEKQIYVYCFSHSAFKNVKTPETFNGYPVLKRYAGGF